MCPLMCPTAPGFAFAAVSPASECGAMLRLNRHDRHNRHDRAGKYSQGNNRPPSLCPQRAFAEGPGGPRGAERGNASGVRSFVLDRGNAGVAPVVPVSRRPQSYVVESGTVLALERSYRSFAAGYSGQYSRGQRTDLAPERAGGFCERYGFAHSPPNPKNSWTASSLFACVSVKSA